jgi:branched-chain amino acid transport system permease protein
MQPTTASSSDAQEAVEVKTGLLLSPDVRHQLGRVPGFVGIALGVLALLWVLFFARGTSAGPAVSEPGEFIVTLLDGVTFAGLLFVVASGFTLVFGLMRTVNMAHGSLFVLSAYVAIEVQQSMVGKERNIEASDVSMWEWVLPMLVGASVVAIVGLIMQQALLRWNQGEDLRQALITLAVSVIMADQMLAHFGGLAQRVVWPGAVTHFFEIFGERYASSRLFMLGLGLLVGALLWLWLNRTRMGMVIRAGVDDQQMVRALGINISVVFAITFFIGAFLAGMGGVMGASFAGVAPGTDGQWLLNSLIVVIIGGLGSIKGAVAGSLLYGMVLAFAPAYLPTEYTFYAIIFTFVLLAIVLAVRPYGLYGKEA